MDWQTPFAILCWAGVIGLGLAILAFVVAIITQLR